MTTHGLAFAPWGWHHAAPGSHAFGFLRAYRGPFAGPEATDTRVFGDQSAVLAVGEGAERIVFPWPLQGPGPAPTPADIARLRALRLDGLDRADLWWADSLPNPTPIANMLRTDGLIFDLLAFLDHLYPHSTRVGVKVVAGDDTAPGWPATRPVIRLYGIGGYGAPALAERPEARAVEQAILERLGREPDTLRGRRWTHNADTTLHRATPVLYSVESNGGKPLSHHELLALLGRIHTLLHTESGLGQSPHPAA